MTNLIYSTLATIELYDPIIFWLFMGLIALAVALTYLHNFKTGLITTILISGFLSLVGEFPPFIYIPLGAASVLFVLDIVGVGNLEEKIKNFSNWLYLKYRVRKYRRWPGKKK